MSNPENASGGVNEPDNVISSDTQETSHGVVDDTALTTSSDFTESEAISTDTSDAFGDTADNGEERQTTEQIDDESVDTDSAAPSESDDEDARAAETSEGTDSNDLSFDKLGLPSDILEAVKKVGFETPSPIQARTIPALMEGRDVVGLAQTGTGKTAAFALPILARIDKSNRAPQALVLAPTRELALQVADAFQEFADHVGGINVLPIYGGQAYGIQLSGLRRGAHIIVGTPGRVIDHLEKGSLDISHLDYLVLDEADEMLNMGFQEDVERILEDTPDKKQVALFSATMPKAILRLSQQYLDDPYEVTVKAETRTNTNITQKYLHVAHRNKLDALTRILEVTEFEAMIIFVRTKYETEELAEKLRARGFSAQAINGDIAQQQRERTVDQLRDGRLDILVATDVAARGLDVERISHVLNYDIPHDTESYIHRIGRTGRAGRTGEAILFVTPRERRMLRSIERVTNATLEEIQLPTVDEVNESRKEKFADSITEALEDTQLALFRSLVKQYSDAHDVPLEDIAAALAAQAQSNEEFLMKEPPKEKRRERRDRDGGRRERDHGPSRPDSDFEIYRLQVGRRDHVRPGAIVGAIANEGGLSNRDFGRIDIQQNFSLVELPKGLGDDVLDRLADTEIGGRNIEIRRDPDGYISRGGRGRDDRGSRGGRGGFGGRGRGRDRDDRGGRGGYGRGRDRNDRGDRGGYGGRGRGRDRDNRGGRGGYGRGRDRY
ncbi:DEAD/DEAH box helicase [Corynebacterium pyruviciproducens]|uniref:DEAD/DEAH box helicase n=1 Tax=Corynebacterium pyruviciproducens TaxID=598660 RepID=UPI0023F17BEF|nr:DEAD/DEAH box helicase [Corynebacterium pyruviciproducens]